MSDHPKDIGDRTTLAVMLALRDAGSRSRCRSARTPATTSSSMTARPDSAPVQDGQDAAWRGASSRQRAPMAIIRHEKPRSATTAVRSDAFAVYCRETRGVYVIPIGSSPLDRAYSGSTHRCNGQRKRIRFAEDYEIATVSCCTSGRNLVDREIGGQLGADAVGTSGTGKKTGRLTVLSTSRHIGRRVDRPGSARGRRAALARLGRAG